MTQSTLSVTYSNIKSAKTATPSHSKTHGIFEGHMGLYPSCERKWSFNVQYARSFRCWTKISGRDNATGCDGYTFAFWHTSWSFWKIEIMGVFKKFFEKGTFTRFMNATFIVLNLFLFNVIAFTDKKRKIPREPRLCLRLHIGKQQYPFYGIICILGINFASKKLLIYQSPLVTAK